MKYLTLCFFIILFTAFAPAHNNAKNAAHQPNYVAYKAGEKLHFALSYSGIGAGEAVMQIKENRQTINNRNHLHISIEGRSLKLFDAVFKVRDYYETYIDEETLLPTLFLRNIEEGSYKMNEHYIFNQQKQQVLSNGKVHNVPSEMHDLVSSFYYLRCIDFSKMAAGTEVKITAFFEEELFPMGVKFVGRKTIKTKVGKIKCLVFEPLLIEGRVFNNQSNMVLYVSDDKNQLPVRIESKVYMGLVKAELTKFSGLKYPLTSLVK